MVISKFPAKFAKHKFCIIKPNKLTGKRKSDSIFSSQSCSSKVI